MKKLITISMLILSALFNQQLFALTYTVTVPEGTNACYITGDMNGWNLSSGLMDKVEGESNVYTITLENAEESHEYKYLCGPSSWDYLEAKNEAGEDLDSNRKYSDSNGDDVVSHWKNLFVPDTKTITIEVWVPSTISVTYIVGSFNAWSGKFNDDYKMNFIGNEEGGKVFAIDLTTDDISTLEFKFTCGPDWAYEQVLSSNFKCSTGVEYEPGKYSFNVQEFKSIFDPSKVGDINIKATVPAGTERVWIQGSFLGWSWDAPAEMTKETDGTFTYTVKLVQQIEYRLYNGSDWAFPEVGEEDPTAERANRKAEYDVENSGKVEEITVWGWKQDLTSVANIDEEQFNIESNQGNIIISGVNSGVEIFDITGRLIDAQKLQGTFASKNLSTGIYIVRIDGISQKVMVK